MNQANHHAAKRFGVLLLIVALSASMLVAHQATAQVPVYRVEGVVYGPDYKPLQGATVAVLTASGSSAGTATTDAAGKFSIANLPSGTYNVTAVHPCCDKDAIPVSVAGTDPVVQQNFRLRSPQGATGGPAVTLKGIVKDEKAGKPVAGVSIEIWNYYEDDAGDGKYYFRPSGGQQFFTTTSGADGTYSFSLRPGHANLIARKDGYDHLNANFEMRDNRTLDLPMRASSGESVLVKGTVTDPSGKPVEGAYVNVQPDYRCTEVCRGYEGGGPSTSDGDVYFYYEPRHGQWNATTTGPDGKYELRVAPGDLLVSADAPDFVHEEAYVPANAGETKTVDLKMERVPPDSVKVSGVVRDSKTGDPIPYAQVGLENQQWGHHNYTVTDKDGKYELWTKPGYTIITASAYRYYYVPCESAAEPTSSDEPTSGDSPKSMPPCGGGDGERDQEYFPRVVTLNGTADKAEPLDFRLEPRPAPSSTFKGYVVNASSQKGVAGANVNFFNERTHDYGTALTDEEGSYQIQVHGGYYTVRVYAPGYFDAVVNAEIGDNREERLDIFATPGERKYGGGCCYAYAEGASYASSPRSASGGPGGAPMAPPGAPPPAMPASGQEESRDATGGQGGQQSYLGSGGGLGPYKPAPEHDGGTSASPGLLVVLLVAGLAVAARRARNR